MRSLQVAALLLASGLGLVVCGGIESGGPADGGAMLSDGTVESAADDGAAFDGAPPGDGGVGDATAPGDTGIVDGAVPDGLAVADASDAALTCNPPCANGFACTQGICMGCTGPSVILAEATGDPNVDGFATEVAVSGSTLLVSAYDGGTGAVYVFTQSGSAWSYLSTLSPPSGVTSFGASIAISGTVAMVSGVQAGSPAVFVYNQTGSTWTPGSVLTPPADGGNIYGALLALDGTTAIVWVTGTSSYGVPSATVYVQSGASWMPQATLTPAEGFPSSAFNGGVKSVALSGDTAVLGLVGSTLAPTYASRADVFVRSGTTWTEQSSLAPSTLIGQEVLTSVGVANDVAVITSSSPENGYVYARSGTTWTQQTAKTQSDAGSNLAPIPFPDPVVVSPGSILAGSALFGQTSTGWQPVAVPPFDAGGYLEVGGAVARSGSTVVMSAVGSAPGAPKGAVLVYSCSP